VLLGFSFTGEVREPFPAVIQALQDTKVPVTSVDAPSSWDIEKGPPSSGLGSSFMPATLVSLTAPKPLVKHFTGRHFVGGRYVHSVSVVTGDTLTDFPALCLHPSPKSTISRFPRTRVSIRLSRLVLVGRSSKCCPPPLLMSTGNAGSRLGSVIMVIVACTEVPLVT
jgi:hypothetical protein